MKSLLLAAYRVRGPFYYAAAVVLVCGAVSTGLLAPGLPRDIARTAMLCALVLLVACMLLAVLVPRVLPDRDTITVRSPVRGRWLGMNSPASKAPSHGVRMYGQTFAIDLVHEPVDRPRPTFGTGGSLRPPHDYPAYGEPVHAMIDGVVVRASGWRRDHRSRSSVLAALYMLVEGMIREAGGPGFILGNHVVIRGTDGVFAAVAHLAQGSPTVQIGDRVRAGEVIGACGNSGNSSEPHVHAQLMDRASVWTAQGIPMLFENIKLDDDTSIAADTLPGNDQHMISASEELDRLAR